MTASQMRIAETIDAFYGDAGTRDGVSRSYKTAVEELDAETIKSLDGPYRTTVLEPISRFCAYFPDINECELPTAVGERNRGVLTVGNRHQEAEPQAPRLRFTARKGQEAG